MKTSRVLITGGLGYVGGRLALALQEKAFEVQIGTRNRQATLPKELASCGIVPLNFEDPASLSAACEGVDTVIHLAGMNEIDAAQNLEGAFVANTLYTIRLLEASQRCGVKRFIYMSTAHVYGAPLSGCIDEETLPKPKHPYALSHKAAEDVVLAGAGRGLESCIVVRLSNSFGAPVMPEVNRWSLVVNDLCRQAAADGKLILKTTGAQLRDFITLSDVCRAFEWLLNLSQDQSLNGIFNLGGARSMSIFDMAKFIGERFFVVTNQSIPIHRPEPTTAEGLSVLDFRIDKLKATGFSLVGDFNNEIDHMLRFCLRHFKNH